jgi:uncharacterized protein YdeI (YjbR/CyaY-like superfamily)
MGTKDARVDAYIAGAAGFARPILRHLRRVVHAGCPDVEETLKWGFPHFQYKGILCSMAAFQSHCSFGFWKGSLMQDEDGTLETVGKTAMGHLGRITAIADLPAEKVLLKFVRQAMTLNDEGVKVPSRSTPRGDRTLQVPDEFMAALRANKKALASFTGFSYTNKKEYVDWVTEAKRDETRRRRLETAIAWLAEGKARNWKYAGR